MSDEWVWVPFEVEKRFDGFRVDRFLAQRLAAYSRSRVQKILEDARVMRGDRLIRAHARVKVGDRVLIAYPRRPEAPLPRDAALPILFEDADLLIVHKPAHLLSHPTDKIVRHTVMGVLRHSRPDLVKLHLLHRLDRETSGVLALAKTKAAARRWTELMEAREIHKTYIALVRGVPAPRKGMIDFPIGRQSGDIKVRQWVNVPGAVAAVTRYEVLRIGDVCSVINAFPKTGRLHQIRVHFAAIGHPVLGDPLYTGDGDIYQRMILNQVTKTDRAALGFPRLALHAASLSFPHPITAQGLRIQAPLPQDMAEKIDKLSLHETFC